jgi:hypothetical protein
VLVSRECEQKYPKVKIQTLARIGSYHNPQLLDYGTRTEYRKRGFRFEAASLTQPDFKK